MGGGGYLWRVCGAQGVRLLPIVNAPTTVQFAVPALLSHGGPALRRKPRLDAGAIADKVRTLIKS